MVKKQENKKIEELENKINELETQLKRAVADYQNLEKRINEGRSELTSFVGGELIKRLLPVLDHLEQVVDHGRPTLSEQSESKGWFQGVELAVKEFKTVLQSEGLDQIAADPSTTPATLSTGSLGTGGVFDPALHEAVDTRVGDDNIILEVVRHGYTLNGKVLRPAQVVVGKKNPPSQEETANIPGGETQSDFHIPPKGEES